MAKLTGTWKTITDELNAVLAKHGVKSGGIHITDYGMGQRKIAIKVRETIKDASGQVVVKESEDYKRYCDIEGMKAEWLGREFSYGGRRFTLLGFNMSKPKNIIAMVEVGTGKKFMAPKMGVVHVLIASEVKAA